MVGVRPFDDHGDGKFQRQQTGGIVDEAFTFQNVHNFPAAGRSFLAMEVAAIASVVATTAPSTNPSRKSKPCEKPDEKFCATSEKP